MLALGHIIIVIRHMPGLIGYATGHGSNFYAKPVQFGVAQ